MNCLCPTGSPRALVLLADPTRHMNTLAHFLVTATLFFCMFLCSVAFGYNVLIGRKREIFHHLTRFVFTRDDRLFKIDCPPQMLIKLWKIGLTQFILSK